MKNKCISCGGIIGVDCFNPNRCAQVEAEMDAEAEAREHEQSEDSNEESLDK